MPGVLAGGTRAEVKCAITTKVSKKTCRPVTAFGFPSYCLGDNSGRTGKSERAQPAGLCREERELKLTFFRTFL